jgi:hypothetical protein
MLFCVSGDPSLAACEDAQLSVWTSIPYAYKTFEVSCIGPLVSNEDESVRKSRILEFSLWISAPRHDPVTLSRQVGVVSQRDRNMLHDAYATLDDSGHSGFRPL